MSWNKFTVRRLLIDKAIERRYLARQAIAFFRKADVIFLESEKIQTLLCMVSKKNRAIIDAKKTLVLTQNKGSFFKKLVCHPHIYDPERTDRFRLEMMQGCPADCHYCFCQTYLQSPYLVVYCNPEQIVERSSPVDLKDNTIITGDISDSLALGEYSILLHKYIQDIVPQSNFELRTKFPLPDGIEVLDACRTRLDYSLSPLEEIKNKEPGTADLGIRLTSIRKALDIGFDIGIRFDPIQPVDAGESDYLPLLKQMKHHIFKDRSPIVFILGSYKLSRPLKETIRTRFPGSTLPAIEWVTCIDGKKRPFRKIRSRAYRNVSKCIRAFFPDTPIVMSMEPVWMWHEVGLPIY